MISHEGLRFGTSFHKQTKNKNLRCGASALVSHLSKKWGPAEGKGQHEVMNYVGVENEVIGKLKWFWEVWTQRRGDGGRVGRIAKVFAFGIELTPEIASSKKLHTKGEASQFGPLAHCFLQTRTRDLPNFSDLSGPLFRLPRLFWALPWVILGVFSGCQG